jgi:alcohol dehydrogenase class IV
MKDFQHHTPPLRLHHGGGALAELPRELDRLGCRRAVVFCGASMARPGGGLERVAGALGERLAATFCGVREHSPLPSVEAGARVLQECGADAVVALGGGSAIVTARAATIVAAEGQPVRALCTRADAQGRMTSPRLLAPKLPQFVLPTTPTTACVKAGSAVHDPATGERLALFDPKTRAQAVFIDGGLLALAPVTLLRGAALNALAMAVEGLESAQGDPLSDALLMHAVRLLARGLPQLDAMPQDAGLRGELVLAAILTGQGTDFTGGGLASVLGHAIGPRCGVANGIVNAIVLPHTLRFNASHTGERMWKLAASLPASEVAGSGSDPLQAIAAVEALLAQLPLPRRLRETRLVREDIPAVVAQAQADFFLQRNPRPVQGRDELAQLVQACW